MARKKLSDLPIAYKTGVAHFYGEPFFVNRHTLIPRKDTEVLVNEVIKIAEAGMRVLDLCTGTGCIAIMIKRLCPELDVVALDVSKKALGVAKRNAKLHRVDIEFVRGDMFDLQNIKDLDVIHGLDMIVCNPPYIRRNEIGKHDPSILYEPKLALDGGADGLDFYRTIARSAFGYMNDGGKLLLEIGFDQANDVKSLLASIGWSKIEITQDLAGRDRVVMAVWSATASPSLRA